MSAAPMPSLDAVPAQPGDDARSEPCADRRSGHHRNQRARGDRHHFDEDERGEHRLDRVAHVERAGNQLVGHQAPRPEDCGRRGKRSDAERIEEHGDEASVTSSWTVGRTRPARPGLAQARNEPAAK